MGLPKTRPPISPAEFQRGKWDVARWAWVFLGIRMHPGQIKMAEAYLRRTESRWRAFYFWVLVSAGNRAGKTLGLSLIILHSCVYRMGMKPPAVTGNEEEDAKSLAHWGRIPYHWWHFAIEQAPAEQVFMEIALILGGSHAAQTTGCPWMELLGDGDNDLGVSRFATLTTQEGMPWCTGAKERGEYAWIKLKPDWGGAEIHFRSTKAKALSAIGQNMNGLSFDEAGLEPNLTYLLEEVMHARRLTTGGQFIIISTPSVATSTDFADLWYKGDPEDPFREKRRFSMRMSSRDNIGYGMDLESFEGLIEGQPDDWVRQNIDGEFIQAFNAWFNGATVDAAFNAALPVEQEPHEGLVYIHSLDPGLKDKCWSMVFRVTKDRRAIGVSLTKQTGRQTTRGIIALGVRSHQRYGMRVPKTDLYLNYIDTGVDTTALGGHMFRELIEEHITIKSVEFGGVTKTKRLLLSDTKSALDEGRIEMPAEGDWKEMRNQLKNYKLLDRKIEQDLVMGLAIIVKLLRQAPLNSGEAPTILDMTAGIAEHDAQPKESTRDGITSKSIRASMAAKRAARRAAVESALTEDVGGE